MYTIHMKRTNLVLDEALLEEARQVLGERTYSETVNKALKEAVRVARVRSIPDLLRMVQWEGDLAEMRQDKPRATAAKRRAS